MKNVILLSLTLLSSAILCAQSNPVLDDISWSTQSIGVSGERAIIDLNGDNLDDVIGATSSNINVHYQQPSGGFVVNNIAIPTTTFSPSWSMAAGDINRDGYADLVYGAGTGVSLVISEPGGNAYTQYSGPEYVFSQRTNMVDINNDGNLDVFVCHDVDPNVYYLNDGNGNMTFFQGGLGDTPQGGNYGSVWIDYDNDNDIDMFIAKCGADPWNQLHRNDGNGVFTEVTDEVGLTSDVQTWSSAWADYDNDGDMDVLVGSSSNSATHQLMRNDNGIFTEVTVGSGFDTASGTSIENCAQDFNNDGYVDVLGVGGALMLNNGDMTFTQYSSIISNGAIGDINNDGFLDVLTWGNLYVNNGNQNNYLRVHLEGVESNRDGIGARVEVTSALGTQIRDIRSGEGFSYMSSLTAHFGIDEDTEIEQVVVHWPSGTMDVISNPDINSLLVIEEGMSATSINEFEELGLEIFPSPATDVLNIRSESPLADPSVMVLNMKGQEVLNSVLNGNTVNISSLSSGQYLLRLRVDGAPVEQAFIKQ